MNKLLLNVTIFKIVVTCVWSFQTSNLNPKIKRIDSIQTFQRNLVTNSVSQRNEYDNVAVSEKDQEEIFQQLGYIPSNLISIAARRGGGINTPLVLKTYPLNGGASRRKAKAEGVLTPFPTLYWFCCKEVGKAISDLERRGYVGKLEQRLRDEPGMVEQFIRCHNSYANERWYSLTEGHQQYILKNERMLKILRDSGIAGTDYEFFRFSKDPSIKCLHAHYGHYRGQMEKNNIQRKGEINDNSRSSVVENVNIVGKWIDDLLKDEFPDLIL